MLHRNCKLINANRMFAIIFSFSLNHQYHFLDFAISMVFDDKLATVERQPMKNDQIRFISNKCIKQTECLFQLLTKRVSKTPAAKMKIVWENCCTIPPQIRPTKPNRVIIIRDNFSARPCPSKSYNLNETNVQLRIHWMVSTYGQRR